MKIEKILGLILCILTLVECTNKEKAPTLEKGKAVITGRVSNLSEESKVIRFAAQGTIKRIEHTALIDSLGNFRLEIELYHPQNVQVYFKQGYVELYLQPLDSIYLEIDEDKLKAKEFPEILISGTEPDAEISREIQKYLKFSGENQFNPDAKGKSVNEFIGILKDEIDKQDSVLQSFCKSSKVSSEFKTWAEKDIRYKMANSLLTYHVVNQEYEGNLFDESLFPVDDDAAIISTLYPVHLRHYALNKGFWRDTLALNLLKKGDNVKAYNRCFDNILGSVEKGLSRDIMCYKLLLDLYAKSFDDFYIVHKNIDKHIENPLIKSALNEKIEENRKQKSLDISFLDPVTKEEKAISGDFWNNLKEKHKGKVIYVDIWATWCGPCRGEISHAIELHEYFKGKEIVFVNLCLSSVKSEWQKMIKNNNIKGENYFFNKAQSDLLRSKLKRGYPTYLIIDREGNLVDKNAPRPSSGMEIRKILDDWIGKNSL